MFASLLFYYNCGHVSDTYAPGRSSGVLREKVCPVCHSGGIQMVEFDCEMCGISTQTTASGLKRSRRFLCQSCRKLYNNWENMVRKAQNENRDYPDLQQYIKNKTQKPSLAEEAPPSPEPPLTPQEFAEIARFGKRASPCAQCPHIACDKNFAPCDACTKLAQYTQKPHKLFLDSLYI